MKKIKLEIAINASPENVWDAIVNKDKFRQWTVVFQEGSYFEGGWNKGDSIRFLALNKEGQKVGMVSEIAESNYPEYISIRHLGYIANGVEDTTSEEVKKWAPSYENYTLEKLENQKTRFILDIEVSEGYYGIFMEVWPKALEKLKEVSEKNA